MSEFPARGDFARPRTLAVTALLAASAAGVGSLAGQGARSAWYRALRKPGYQPPAPVFPLVWTALYADIAVSSAYAADHTTQRDRTAYLRVLAANLAVNSAWSWIFFRAHRTGAAALTAGVLAASSADLTRRTLRVDRRAGGALVPYAVWCLFATVLSTDIWRRNRPSTPGTRRDVTR
ncbi:TspO/MBR family protein [Nocardia sp. AG03]|uniref:TspO/MBR family protein n=1 Tax=Nocardia sp. AG03 TaxID=3025312 RepID=UPI0024184AD2|nr:TspO/MBR family protein [Nocardia sp. AG03]